MEFPPQDRAQDAKTSNLISRRLETLEEIANSFKGVERSFAIQAGREVRIMVKSDAVNDDETILMAKEIVKKIENEMEYPGQIKVQRYPRIARR